MFFLDFWSVTNLQNKKLQAKRKNLISFSWFIKLTRTSMFNEVVETTRVSQRYVYRKIERAGPDPVSGALRRFNLALAGRDKLH